MSISKDTKKQREFLQWAPPSTFRISHDSFRLDLRVSLTNARRWATSSHIVLVVEKLCKFKYVKCVGIWLSYSHCCYVKSIAILIVSHIDYLLSLPKQVVRIARWMLAIECQQWILIWVKDLVLLVSLLTHKFFNGSNHQRKN